jgi:hypothetical protein
MPARSSADEDDSMNTLPVSVAFSITCIPAYLTVCLDDLPPTAKILMIMFSLVSGFVLGGISGVTINESKGTENDHEPR